MTHPHRKTSRFQRARAPERKTERRDAILAAAERLIRGRPFGEIKLERVAAKLGLAKGTLYLYFDTKEALFLAVLRRVFEAFFARLEAALPAGRASRDEVVRALLESLDATPTLPALASVLHGALEHNASDADVRAFKLFLRERVLTIGAALDRALRAPESTGATLLLRFHVLVIGLHHATTPSAAVERALEDPSLALFRLDFRAELEAMLRLALQSPR